MTNLTEMSLRSTKNGMILGESWDLIVRIRSILNMISGNTRLDRVDRYKIRIDQWLKDRIELSTHKVSRNSI